MTLSDILSMFGSEPARQEFHDLCSRYYGERVRQEAFETTGEPLWKSRRAEVHNQIKQTIQKLFLRSKDRTPSRKEVGDMIMDHFRSDQSGEKV